MRTLAEERKDLLASLTSEEHQILSAFEKTLNDIYGKVPTGFSSYYFIRILRDAQEGKS